MLLTFLGHSSFAIKTGDYVIYIDPHVERYKGYGDLYKSLKKADLILISHFDPDHYNRDTIDTVRYEDTKIYSNPRVASEIDGCVAMEPEKILNFDDVKLKAMNLSGEGHGENYSFLLKIEGKTLYFVGDTKIIPKKPEEQIDILFVPVGGTHTLTPRQANQVVEQVNPTIIIPTHYGKTEGTIDSAEYLQELVGAKAKVLIIKVGEVIEL